MTEARRAFVTGIAGFVGSHLAGALQERGMALFGTRMNGESLDRLDPEIAGGIGLYECDLRDTRQIEAALEAARPTQIYHLAALSSVHDSFTRPDETYSVNVEGTINLLKAVRERFEPPYPRFLFVSSGEVYGRVPEDGRPVDEDLPLFPKNPYAASKAACEMYCCYFSRMYRIPIVRVRPFHLIGPGQRLGFFVSDMASQIASLEGGGRFTVKTGNLNVYRDFLDVRDGVRAMIDALEHGPSGEVYNICSGIKYRLYTLLELLLSGVSGSFRVIQDENRLRPVEIPVLFGSNERLRRVSGWTPGFEIEKSLADSLEYFRAQEREGDR